jgi:hypothetical protein
VSPVQVRLPLLEVASIVGIRINFGIASPPMPGGNWTWKRPASFAAISTPA